MRDYNFFQPYLFGGKGRGPSDDQFPYVLFVLLLIIAVAALPAYNYYQLGELQSEVTNLSTSVLDDPNYALLAVVSSQQGVVNDARFRLSSVQSIEKILHDSEWVDEVFLDALLGVFPRDIVLLTLTVSPAGQVQIVGQASNKPAIAELELNLRNTGHFRQLHVTTISRSDEERTGAFGFVLVAQVKGVGVDAPN